MKQGRKRAIFGSSGINPALTQMFADFGVEDQLPQKGMLYVRVRAISARVNRNFDGFTSEELKRAAHTFEGKPVFVDHHNSNPDRTRGIIIAQAYRDENLDKYIELLIEVDAKNFPKLAKEIEQGGLDSVSMGCNVEATTCSWCGNTAYSMDQFCDHVIYLKGETLPGDFGEDVLVYEICH